MSQATSVCLSPVYCCRFRGLPDLDVGTHRLLKKEAHSERDGFVYLYIALSDCCINVMAVSGFANINHRYQVKLVKSMYRKLKT